MPRSPRRRGTASVLALALLAACTSSNTRSSAPTPTTPSTTAVPTVTSPGTDATTPASTPAPTADVTTSSGPPRIDASPEALAAELVAVERAIRDPAVTGDALDGWGARQQLAYRAIGRHPDWIAAITAQLPTELTAAVGWNLMARQALADHAAANAASTSTPPAPPPATLPAWTIVEPLPIDELLADYREAEQRTGVPWAYLAAIHLMETRMGRIVGASSAGAIGPMQFLPATWARCCTGDVLDAHDAIIGAATFLAAHGAPRDMTAAVHAYNPNDGYVGAVLAYAQAMLADPLAYRGYHGWQVYMSTSAGTIRLDPGYHADAPVDAATYLAAHPDALG